LSRADKVVDALHGFDVKGEVKPVPHPIETEEQLLLMAANVTPLKAQTAK
jgi:hypothetical protein